VANAARSEREEHGREGSMRWHCTYSLDLCHPPQGKLNVGGCKAKPLSAGHTRQGTSGAPNPPVLLG